MNAIDRKFLDCPFYGVERMTDYLRQDLGYFGIRPTNYIFDY